MNQYNALLTVKDLAIAYGNIKAVKGISFEVFEGEIVTLIGANGAGKSSTLRAISGLIPYTGTIQFRGQDLKKVPADRIVGMGIAQVPEGRGIFGNLTVLENLKLATWQRKDKAEIGKDYDRVFGIFPRLNERKTQQAGTLSGGEQQMLAVARILRTGAKLLLLDEISEGLAPVIVQALARMILMLREQGYTVVMVEQNFRFAAPLADRFYVMEHGAIALQFGAAELEEKMPVLNELLGV